MLVSRQDAKWGLVIRLGGDGSGWLRETLRAYVSESDGMGRFTEALEIKAFVSRFNMERDY